MILDNGIWPKMDTIKTLALEQMMEATVTIETHRGALIAEFEQ